MYNQSVENGPSGSSIGHVSPYPLIVTHLSYSHALLCFFRLHRTRGTEVIEPQLTLRGHTAAITSLTHSPSKRLLYSASLDSSIRVWILPASGHTTYAPYDATRARGELIGHTDAVWGLALLRDESLLVSCGSEGSVKVWEVGSTSGVGSLKLSWGFNGLDSEEETSESPGATCLEPIKSDLKKVAVGYSNSVTKIFDIDTGKQQLALQPELSEGMHRLWLPLSYFDLTSYS